MLVQPWNRTAFALAAIFAVALGLRLGWVAATDTFTPPLSDPQYYHATAQNLAEGRGYSVAVGFGGEGFFADDESESTAFWPPGYPFALAAVYRAFGDDQRNAQLFNAVVGALTVVPVFFIGRSLTPRPRIRRAERGRDVIGLMAAAFFGVMPAMVYWTSALFSEPLFALGAATTLALAVQAPRDSARTSMVWSIAIGLALGATALVRSQGLVLVLPLAVLLVHSLEMKHALRALAPVALACAAVIVPWSVRNAAVMGEPYVINSNLCYNLRAAHAPYSTGGSVAPQDLWDEQPGISFRERERLFDESGCGRAWNYAREHPRRELELSAKRAGWLLRSDAAPAIEWATSLGRTPVDGLDDDAYVLIGDLYWYPMLALAMLSAVVPPRTRTWEAIWSLLLAWVALHLVFHGEPRYHVPMMPVLASLAAATVMEIAGRILEWSRGSVSTQA